MSSFLSTTDGFVSEIIDQIAGAINADSTDLQTPLYDAIDPDALGCLLAMGTPMSPISVEFTYAGMDVVVTQASDVTVDVDPTSARFPEIGSHVDDVRGPA